MAHTDNISPRSTPSRTISAEEARAILDAAHVKGYNDAGGSGWVKNLKLSIRNWQEGDKHAGVVDKKFWAAFGEKGPALKQQFEIELKNRNATYEQLMGLLEKQKTRVSKADRNIYKTEKSQEDILAGKVERMKGIKYPPAILDDMFGQSELFTGSGAVHNLDGPIEFTFDAGKMSQLAQGINPAAGEQRKQA